MAAGISAIPTRCPYARISASAGDGTKNTLKLPHGMKSTLKSPNLGITLATPEKHTCDSRQQCPTRHGLKITLTTTLRTTYYYYYYYWRRIAVRHSL